MPASPPLLDASLPLVEEMPPWRLYLSLEGRIDRRCFWLRGVLTLLVVSVVLTTLLRIAGMRAEQADHLANLLLAWPFLAVSVKRWHDRDRSGWWALLSTVPLGVTLLVPANSTGMLVVGILGLACWLWTLLQTGFLPGTPGPNRFGEPPHGD